MADTRMQLVVEDWVRENWMRARFARDFQRKRVDLSTNGKGRFDFDAVAMDGAAVKIVASISTSGRSTASGKLGTGKLHKLRSDMLFLLLAKDVERRLLVLTERDMYNLCVGSSRRDASRRRSSCTSPSCPTIWRTVSGRPGRRLRAR